MVGMIGCGFVFGFMALWLGTLSVLMMGNESISSHIDFRMLLCIMVFIECVLLYSVTSPSSQVRILPIWGPAIISIRYLSR